MNSVSRVRAAKRLDFLLMTQGKPPDLLHACLNLQNDQVSKRS
jgi:hypothetical protein